jgi:hypothetical protein
MTDQIHIRDGETVRLLRAMARQTGRSVTEVLREAVRAHAPAPRTTTPVDARRLLADDRAQLLERAGGGEVFGLDDLYGADGLPR